VLSPQYVQGKHLFVPSKSQPPPPAPAPCPKVLQQGAPRSPPQGAPSFRHPPGLGGAGAGGGGAGGGGAVPPG